MTELTEREWRIPGVLANKYQRRGRKLGFSFYDLQNEASVELLKAARTFDPQRSPQGDRGRPPYLYQCVERRLIRLVFTQRFTDAMWHIERRCKTKTTRSDEYIRKTTGHFDQIDNQDEVEILLSSLERRDRYVVERTYFDDMEQSEIGTALDISRSMVSLILCKARHQMRVNGLKE